MAHDLNIRVRNMRPDPPDLRDRLYNPTLRSLHSARRDKPWADAGFRERVRDQGESQACTGFALAALAEGLLWEQWKDQDQRENPPPLLSPWMLYYFALRYDEFPGEDPEMGSSARAAMKAWSNHGVCEDALWKWSSAAPVRTAAPQADAEAPDSDPHARVAGGNLEVSSPPASQPDSDEQHPKLGGAGWVANGFLRPLGAYYRIDQCDVRDIHAAIAEIGYVYVTAQIHAGWSVPDAETGEIPYTAGTTPIGGHAFLLVGYDEQGFWLQNSWGPTWGKNGFARISYADWRAHAMDAWVAQLGVHISSHVLLEEDDLSQGLNPQRLEGIDPEQLDQQTVGFRLLSSSRSVRDQQINPYVVNLGNNGFLSDRGEFRTADQNLQELVNYYLNTAIEKWGIKEDEPIDIALYAHGGLTDENGAANTAARWIPELFARRIFPVFFMWETGLLDTWRDIREDRGRLGLTGAEGAAGANLWDRFKAWQDERIEILAASKLFDLWAQMKQNARAASEPRGAGEHEDRGIYKLYEQLKKLPDSTKKRLRFHLIGHSAGSEFHAHLLPTMVKSGLRVDGIYLMAPACTVGVFNQQIRPHLESGAVPVYTQYHLSDAVERKDTCSIPVVNIPAYRKSLLYLVSNGLERPSGTALLGMERYFDPERAGIPAGQRKTGPDWEVTPPGGKVEWTVITSPTTPLPSDPALASTSTSHGGFDNDPATLLSVVSRIARRAKRPLS